MLLSDLTSGTQRLKPFYVGNVRIQLRCAWFQHKPCLYTITFVMRQRIRTTKQPIFQKPLATNQTGSYQRSVEAASGEDAVRKRKAHYQSTSNLMSLPPFPKSACPELEAQLHPSSQVKPYELSFRPVTSSMYATQFAYPRNHKRTSPPGQVLSRAGDCGCFPNGHRNPRIGLLTT